MRRFLTLTISLLCLSAAVANAQMSDEAVVDYVKTGMASGKGEKQIGKELLARGVTMEQVERIKAKYESQQGGETVSSEASIATSSTAIRREATTTNQVAGSLDGVSAAVPAPTEAGKESMSRNIFGHEIFTGKQLSFEPNINLPTPENYILGPGDEVVVDIWGENEASFRQTISPEGRIMVSQVGPVYLNGMSIKKANEFLRKKFAQKYAGIDGDDPSSEISLSLGNIRTIQVNILGEVSKPGTYRISSFSNVFHALYVAGGVTNRGTIRAVEVLRGGKLYAKIDMYPFILSGKFENDFQLRDNDVVRVPLYGMIANIEGQVKRPMFYEIKSGETLQTLIDYAGGFDVDSYRDELRIVRQTGREREMINVKNGEFQSFLLEDGDAVNVGASLDRFANRVEVRGSVFRPGMYELGRDVTSVKTLIEHAEGLMEDAFTDRVRLLRQQDDFTPEVMSVNLTGIMKGLVADVPLRKNDVLIIPNIHELKDLGSVSINGFVAKPGTFTYAENMTIEDVILQAGGLLDGASSVRIDVSRRLNDHESLMPTDQLAESFSFALDLGLKMENSINFKLKPYDIIYVRKSPGYREQSEITIEGEVAFPGSYALLTNNERLSDLIKRAGGVTPHAYLHGAVLVRQTNEEERTLISASNRMVRQGGGKDSVAVSKLQHTAQYTVGLELDKAVAEPGSDYDLILRAGDRLIIPEYLSTVKINGDVMYPNTVLYMPGKPIRYYVDLAGGYGSSAKKSKAYIIYMNGNVAARRNKNKVEPGCEIIIPTKAEKKGMGTAETLATLSTVTSMSTMVASMINLFRR